MSAALPGRSNLALGPVGLSGDGLAPEILEALARRMGIPVGRPGGPLVMVAEAPTSDQLTTALQPPYGGCVEAAAAEDLDAVIACVAAGGQAVQVSAAVGLAADLGLVFAAAVADRHAVSQSIRDAMATAVHEAVVNAIVHGSLDLGGDGRDTPEGLATYCRLLYERQADPAHGGRPVTVTADSDGASVAITVRDRGLGFDPGTASKGPARGLALMRGLAQDVVIGDGGRVVTMTFGLVE